MPMEIREHIPPDQVEELQAEVDAMLRGQLSMSADADDDWDTRREDVTTRTEPADDGGIWVVAYLDAEPTANEAQSDEDDGREIYDPAGVS